MGLRTMLTTVITQAALNRRIDRPVGAIVQMVRIMSLVTMITVSDMVRNDLGADNGEIVLPSLTTWRIVGDTKDGLTVDMWGPTGKMRTLMGKISARNTTKGNDHKVGIMSAMKVQRHEIDHTAGNEDLTRPPARRCHLWALLREDDSLCRPFQLSRRLLVRNQIPWTLVI